MNREELERLAVEEANAAVQAGWNVQPGQMNVTGVVHALLALRYSVLAALADDDLDPEPRWCRVELFGHQIVYGHVAEVRVAGRRFLQVDEPALVVGEDPAQEYQPGRRRQFNPSAVYALEDVGEDAVLAKLSSQPGDPIPF